MEIIIAIVVGIIIWVVIKNKKSSAIVSSRQGRCAYGYDIVGENSYQQNLAKIAGKKEELSKFHECTAKVTSDPLNKYDQNAVKVEINGLLVGYLNRAEAQKLSGKTVNKTVPAVIDGGWNDSDSTGSYGVKLAVNSVDDLL